jgi:Putative zinc-finger
MSCEVQAVGTIELYFYGELPLAERAGLEAHVKHCAECRAALQDLSVIRAALAMRPDVATPPGGDWSGFMARLEEAIGNERRGAGASVMNERRGAGASVVNLRGDEGREGARVIAMPARRRLAPYLALAAMLALVTISVALVVRARRADAPPQVVVTDVRPATPVASERTRGVDPAFVSLSGQHFERSKLVVLGLATKDASAPSSRPGS